MELLFFFFFVIWKFISRIRFEVMEYIRFGLLFWLSSFSKMAKISSKGRRISGDQSESLLEEEPGGGAEGEHILNFGVTKVVLGLSLYSRLSWFSVLSTTVSFPFDYWQKGADTERKSRDRSVEVDSCSETFFLATESWLRDLSSKFNFERYFWCGKHPPNDVHYLMLKFDSFLTNYNHYYPYLPNPFALTGYDTILGGV